MPRERLASEEVSATETPKSQAAAAISNLKEGHTPALAGNVDKPPKGSGAVDKPDKLDYLERRRKDRQQSDDKRLGLQSGLRIDKNDLDSALVEQPDLFYRVSEEYSLVISQRDAAKQFMDEQKAEADNYERRRAADNNEKVSEAQIAGRVLLDNELRIATADYLDFKALGERWLALKEAYIQRSYVLKDLASLYASGYFTRVAGGSARSQAGDRLAEDRRAETGDARDKAGYRR